MDTTQLLQWAWLAGLFDGEGFFTVTYEKRPPSTYHARAAVSLRADDWQTLRYIQEFTGIGGLRYQRAPESLTRPNQNPTAGWQVARIDDCITLIEGLENGGGLRAKKARDYALWKEAVFILDKYGGGIHSPMAERLGEIKAQLHEVKRYSPEMAEGAANNVGVRVQKRGGRGSHAFWAADTERSRTERHSRQLRYAKLAQEDIDTIVSRVAQGDRRADIASDFDISVGLISKFISGKYIRRDGTLEEVRNVSKAKVTDPSFWSSEAGQRAHRNQAAIRGKLSQSQIDELVARYKEGETTMRQLAEEYGVSRPLIAKFTKGNYIRRD